MTQATRGSIMARTRTDTRTKTEQGDLDFLSAVLVTAYIVCIVIVLLDIFLFRPG